MDLKPDALEICVPNDFISEWIGSHFSKPIQEAAQEVLGGPLSVRFNVVPQLFHLGHSDGPVMTPDPARMHVPPVLTIGAPQPMPPVHRPPVTAVAGNGYSSRSRLRHELSTFVVGASNQLAFNAACNVAEYPGTQYTTLF